MKKRAIGLALVVFTAVGLVVYRNSFKVDGACERISRAIANIECNGEPTPIDLFDRLFEHVEWDGIARFGPYECPAKDSMNVGLERHWVLPLWVSFGENCTYGAIAVSGNRVMAYAWICCRATVFSHDNRHDVIYRKPLTLTASKAQGWVTLKIEK